MSSSDEVADVHTVAAREAPGSAKARQARVPCWARAALAVALVMHLVKPSTAEAAPPAPQPTPYQLPQNWGNLPSPTTPVRMQTAIGVFTLPMGYLQAWFVFKDRPVVTAPDGTRVFSGLLAFEFEFPSGGMNANTPWHMAVHDEHGRVVPDRTVVFVHEVAPPNDSLRKLEAETLGTHAPGTLVRDDRYNWGEHETWRGAAAGSGPGHRVGVELNCIANCRFYFYLERQGVVMDGDFDAHYRHDGLAIAEQAQALFEQWQTEPADKRN